jgi:hypothetical protein
MTSLDVGNLAFLRFRQRVRVLKQSPVLVEQIWMLYPSDDQNSRGRQGVLQGQPGVFDHPAGKRLHRNHPDVLLDGPGNDLSQGGGFEEAEADHDSVDQAIIDRLIQHIEAVARDSDMADQALFLRPLQSRKG